MISILLLVSLIAPTDLTKVDQISLDTLDIFKTPLVAVEPGGTILLGDRSEQKLLFFDKELKQIATGARKGEGPGEFVYMDSMRWDSGSQHFVIVDYTRGALSYWTSKGEFVREKKIVNRLNSYQFFGDVAYGVTDNSGKAGTSPKIHRLVGETKTKLWEQKLQNEHGTHVANEEVIISVGFPWDPNLLYATDNKVVVHSYTATKRIVVIDATNGKEITSWSVVFPTPELTKEQIKKQIDPLPDFYRKPILKNLKPPEHWPFVSAVQMDDQSRVWVYGPKTIDDTSVAIAVYDIQGKQLKRLTLPTFASAIESDLVYILHEDDEEETLALERHRIVF